MFVGDNVGKSDGLCAAEGRILDRFAEASRPSGKLGHFAFADNGLDVRNSAVVKNDHDALERFKLEGNGNAVFHGCCVGDTADIKPGIVEITAAFFVDGDCAAVGFVGFVDDIIDGGIALDAENPD